MHDILIRGGILFDGAGHSGIVGNLAIEADASPITRPARQLDLR
jgi:N-acyl-D-aspartate/D-glutamate deacylase